MRMIARIARTDLAILFGSPIAWFIWIVFSVLTASDFTSRMGSAISSFDLSGKAEGSLSCAVYLGHNGFFSSVISNLYIFIPLLTMGLISRETASGSIKLVYSSPVTSGQIVRGKYLAAIGFGGCMMLVPLLAVVYGGMVIPSFDWLPVCVGLLGLYLLVCAYCAVGLFMSSLTTYQVVAAIGTLITLAALKFVGTVGQEYDFVRDVTYWLSIDGRTHSLLVGVVRSDDVVYFMAVIAMFLAFTVSKLAFERRTVGSLRQGLHYTGILLAVMLVGYAVSRPQWIGVWDATRTKQNSLTENSRRILSQMKGPVTVTNYVNLLDGKSYKYLPNMNKFNESIFEPYGLAKPDMKIRYVYYYDEAMPYGLNNNPRFQGKTIEELRDYMVMVYNLNPRLFKSPEEIRRIVDLSSEQNTFVRIIRMEDGRSAFIRDFQDMLSVPSEAEITAAIKKMISVPPVVAFIRGDGEREAMKSGDRDYSGFSVEKYSRAALVNQGFEVRELDLSHGDTIPEEVNILVVAEMKTPFSDTGRREMDAYVARGGNMLLLTDVGRQEVMNPFLESLGMRMGEGRLAQPSEDFAEELILAEATPESGNLTFGFKENLSDENCRISMPGCTALLVTGRDSLFCYTPVLKAISDVTAYGLSRFVEGHEQRILICGDADCMSNAELQIVREGYLSGNFPFIIECFRWLSGGDYPIDVRRPHASDNRFSVHTESIAFLKVCFMGVIPVLLLLTGTAIWFFRRRH